MSPPFPQDEPLLVHTVSWSQQPIHDAPGRDVEDQRTPHLVVTRPLPRPDGASRFALPLVGQRLAFVVDRAGRQCLGARVASQPGSGVVRHEPCPMNRVAASGTQCTECALRDEGRFMHHAHRGGYVPESIEQQLALPHWLYVATFADGTSKVGTAIDHRKCVRLDEQGALRGTYVARTDDGRTVRVLEDAVTAEAGIPQHKRKSIKAAGLTRVLPPSTLDERHADAVAQALRALEPFPGERPLEAWSPPPSHDRFFARCGVHPPYPHSLDGGEHCFTPITLVGSVALVNVNPVDDTATHHEDVTLVDLDALRGRRITFTDDARSPGSAVQHSLF